MSNQKTVRHRHNSNNNKNNKNESNHLKTTADLNNNKTEGKIKHSISEIDLKRISYLASTEQPFHSVRDSLLSSASGFINYRGVLNLCVVLLVMSTGRLVIENILKYGVLVRFDILILFIKDPTAWPSALAFVCSNIFILLALFIEKKLEQGKLSERFGSFLCLLNVTTAMILPAVYLWYRGTNPIASFFSLATYTCVTMKLFSYYQVNKAMRAERKLNKTFYKNDRQTPPLSPIPEAATPFININKKSANGTASIPQVKSCHTISGILKNNQNKAEDDDEEETLSHLPQPLVFYPDNLNLKDLYYFIAVPTLCYELNFPRTSRIRKRFLIKRLTEIAFLITLQIMLVQQWIVPILQNSKGPLRETNLLKIVERVLKLAVPNHVIWLFAFYGFFHSYMNILAELLRFGDRQFYRDWWNAETVEAFWKDWNIPVHSFCLRHIYKPLILQGITKTQASLIVFFVSAFLHEYLVSIPLRMFRLWAFSGMLLQVPFAAFVGKYLHGNYGNMAVWVSLIIGQPASIMMYIHDYYYDYFRSGNVN